MTNASASCPVLVAATALVVVGNGLEFAVAAQVQVWSFIVSTVLKRLRLHPDPSVTHKSAF